MNACFSPGIPAPEGVSPRPAAAARSTRFRAARRAALCAGAALLVAPAAWAFNPPASITIDGGPLGPLNLSGGADGYGYVLSGTGSDTSPGLLGTDKTAGAEFLNGEIMLSKTTGLVQFALEAAAINSLTLGTKPGSPSIQTFSTGPIRTASITLAPVAGLTISAGQLGSLEGYESGLDWNNANLLNTDIFYVQNSQSVGVSASYTLGPVAATVMFGDGFDTNQWNFLQWLVTYTVNSNNAVSFYGGANLGTTGLGAHIYGSATTPWNQSFVGSYGSNYVNSTMFGGYYSFTAGNLTLVPEVQYVYSKPNASVGIPTFTSNFGAALFANYQFGKSPYSIGGWVQYFTSNGRNNWFLNPGAEGVGLSITPTWQGKNLFVRGDFGYIHLTNIGRSDQGAVGYGSGLNGRDQVTAVLEAGVLF